MRRRRRKRVILPLALAIVVAILVSGFLFLSSVDRPNTSPQYSVSISRGAPLVFGCGPVDVDNGAFLSGCINSTLLSESGNSFTVVLFATFANSTTGQNVTTTSGSNGCNVTPDRPSVCLVLFNLAQPGAYKVTLFAMTEGGKTQLPTTVTWVVDYGPNYTLISEGN